MATSSDRSKSNPEVGIENLEQVRHKNSFPEDAKRSEFIAEKNSKTVDFINEKDTPPSYAEVVKEPPAYTKFTARFIRKRKRVLTAVVAIIVVIAVVVGAVTGSTVSKKSNNLNSQGQSLPDYYHRTTSFAPRPTPTSIKSPRVCASGVQYMDLYHRGEWRITCLKNIGGHDLVPGGYLTATLEECMDYCIKYPEDPRNGTLCGAVNYVADIELALRGQGKKGNCFLKDLQPHTDDDSRANFTMDSRVQEITAYQVCNVATRIFCRGLA